jgi:dipeptidyl aminopeptidase/acylaminoacyl peptidase
MDLMNKELHGPGDLTLDSTSKRLFVIGDSAVPNDIRFSPRGDLLWFDVNTHGFQPFLPSIEANEVDFSRDGKRIAFVRVQDFSIGVSRPDGSDAIQIPILANDVELPRWSPDGKLIAFMARFQDRPWRIFIVSALGGKPREASVGTDNQGAPTWSPDGKWLVYGNVQCQETGTCAIHKIDLLNGRELIVPGSEGLGTARWSPDGRFIAALSPEKHEVLIFEVATQEWRLLASGVNGNDLSWSADCRSIFASSPSGNHPYILRIPLRGGGVEEVVDLAPLTRLNHQVETWFALAPDGSIILRRGKTGTELFSLSYAEQ